MTPVTARAKAIVYPDCDGQPMADNTLQWEWIVTIKCGLDAQYADDPNVFIAGDLLWYPVEGEPKIRQAPDTLLAFGRPKGYRGSYRQWQEGGIAPQVVFEIMSPGNRPNDISRRFDFYQRYGVQEYYLYDPDKVEVFGWVRKGDRLEEVPNMNGYVSPLLKIRFEIGDDLRIIGADGRPFATYVELAAQRNEAERGREQAERDREQAERAKEQAERDRAAIQQAAAAAAQAAERLRAQLKAMGVDPEA